MPIKPIASRRILALTAIVPLVLPPGISIAKSPRFEGIQLVRYVLKTTKIPDIHSYWREIENGTLVFDEEYRHPSYPPGPTDVDCTEANRIGVAFMVTRSPAIMNEHARAKFVWTHATVELDDPAATNYKTRSFVRGENAKYFSGGFNLTDTSRVDGVISVRVTIGKYVIVENSFRLIGCTEAMGNG
jgi:hypothetical protein